MGQTSFMLKQWFQKKPLLDQPSIDWLFECFDWFQAEFNQQVFLNETQLVQPTNAFFPGRESSVEGMATLIFTQTQAHACLKNWSCQVVPYNQFQMANVKPTKRLGGDFTPTKEQAANPLFIPYEPAMVSNPESLIAEYAYILSQYLLTTAESAPPGGVKNAAQVSEVLSVFLGFGIMSVNSAFLHRGSCGSASRSVVNRESALSQYDLAYALAIFCHRKEIPSQQVLTHIKPALKAHFKQCVKSVKS